MGRKSSIFVVVSVAAVLAAFAAFFVFRSSAPPVEARSTSEPPGAAQTSAERESAARLPSPSPSARAALSAPTTTARDELLLDEPALMATLRELRGSDPQLTLQLARDGNLRFKDSAGAAERYWFIVKSLSDLGRHDEARIAGRTLVDEYRETRWAEDVYRHLFVNPPTHPFERGYGKALESDP
jgi:hypothetical protein